VVPDDFTGYFAAAATAAGALIGLLFVAASLRPETVLGRGAPPAAQAVAGSAFTALINSFFVSLIALIPRTSLGYTAAIMALLSLYSTWRLHHELARHEAAVLQIGLALLAYLTQLGVGIDLAIHPRASTSRRTRKTLKPSRGPGVQEGRVLGRDIRTEHGMQVHRR